MTENEVLVREVLMGNTCELYDKQRISKLFQNLKLRYGKLRVEATHITITHSSGKSKKMIYTILKESLTDKQLVYVTSREEILH